MYQIRILRCSAASFPCGVYEAIYILDGLLNDESDFNPDTLHGDTQALIHPGVWSCLPARYQAHAENSEHQGT